MTMSDRGRPFVVVAAEVEVEVDVGRGVSVVVVEAKTSATGDIDIAAARASAVAFDASCAQPGSGSLFSSAAARAGSAIEPRRGARSGVCPSRCFVVLDDVGDDDDAKSLINAHGAWRWSAVMDSRDQTGAEKEESVSSALILYWMVAAVPRSWSDIAPTMRNALTRFFSFFLFLWTYEFFFFPIFFRSFSFSRDRSNMTKQTFSTTDVAAEAACLRARVIGYRVTNVYDAGASKVRNDSSRSFASYSAVVVVVSRRRCRRHLSLSHTRTATPSPSPAHRPQGILLKLSRSGDDGDKAFLLLEPGSRFHLTSEPPERPDAPSGFALKLRKHLRSRRLEGLRQLGADRLVDLSFGSGK